MMSKRPSSFSFTKMHGLGNDFVILDARHSPIRLSAEEIIRLGNRHRGIGFDQLLLIEPTTHPLADIRYRIFNPDGKEVQQCGNGARCVAAYLFQHHLSPQQPCRMETLRGIITAYWESTDAIRVDMGVPSFAPESLPLLLKKEDHAALYTLPADPNLALDSAVHTIEFDALSMGNPHAIIRVHSVDQAPVKALGGWLEQHPAFPERTNVEFVEYIDRHTLRLRIFERGVGETHACGTGACAAAASFLHRNAVSNPVALEMPGGSLQVSWEGAGHPLWMTGAAVTVFKGEIILLPSDSNYA
jgi:diaminopimelate epimerase